MGLGGTLVSPDRNCDEYQVLESKKAAVKPAAECREMFYEEQYPDSLGKSYREFVANAVRIFGWILIAVAFL